MYVLDNGNNRIRFVTAAGVVSTIAGSGAAGFSDGVARTQPSTSRKASQFLAAWFTLRTPKTASFER
jgi:hypothetical protein